MLEGIILVALGILGGILIGYNLRVWDYEGSNSAYEYWKDRAMIAENMLAYYDADERMPEDQRMFASTATYTTPNTWAIVGPSSSIGQVNDE